MQRIGGNDLKNFVKRVSERLFTNELTTKYSWAGFRDNQKLRNLKIIKIMKSNLYKNIVNFVNVNAYEIHYVVSFLDVAISTFSDTDINVETVIKNWFYHGPQRYKREQKKKSSKKTHHIINVPELPIQCAALL